jgi:hypothetical protein
MIEPHTDDKRYVRRGKKKFKKEVDVGRSLAKTIVKKGEGDRGDRRA